MTIAYDEQKLSFINNIVGFHNFTELYFNF